MPTLAPRVAAIPNEANTIEPRRRGAPMWRGENSSDGGYVNKPGGHNIGARGLVHAWDVSQSMPGTPYWDPKFGEFDVWAHCYRIAAEYTAATDAERQRRWPWLYDGGYMVWFDGTKDIIFGPKHDRDLGQEPHIRQNGDFKTEHFQHAHIEAAETVRAEQDTQPIFGRVTVKPATPTFTEDDNVIFLAPDQKPSSKPKYVNVAIAKKRVYLHGGARVKQGKPGQTAIVIESPTPLLGATRTADGFVVINEDDQPYWYQWAT